MINAIFVVKVGRGLFSFITYRVYTCIGLDKMAKNEFTVYRRYRDFLKLHEKLEDRLDNGHLSFFSILLYY